MSLLAGMLAAVILAVSQNDVTALLTKHAHYVGWQAGDPALAGWTAKGTRRNGGATDTFTEKRNGIAYRDTLSVADGRINQDQGFTGTVVWETNPNGYTVKQNGIPAQVDFDVNLLRAEALGALSGSSIAGSAQVRGVNATIIRVTPNGSAPMDVYEDPSSGAFLQAVVDPSGAKTLVTIDGYGDAAPGKKAVNAWSIGSLHYSLSSISAGAAADSDLRPPSPRATWTFGGAAVPVQLYDLASRVYEPRVTLSINGVSGVFVLDTGEPSILLYDDFASRAGVAPLGPADFSAYSAYQRYKGYALARTLSAGNSTLQNVLVQVVNEPNAKIAGYVGYDFFAGTIAEIDLSRNTMQLYDPATMAPSVVSGAFAFPIDLTTRRPVVAIPLSKAAYAYPFFSTGEAFFMLLSQHLRDSNAISASDVSIESANPMHGSTGYLGTAVESGSQTIAYSDYTGANGSGACVLLHQVLIGPYRYESPPLCFVGSNVFGQTGGLIGNDFLRHFDWTVDYPDAKFVLTPNSIQ